jgi:hypothetical protein
MKGRPAWQEHHFRGDGGQILPRKLAEQRQIKLAERVHLRDAAEAHDVGTRFVHKRRVGRIASELQCKIRLHRSVNLARTTVIDIPAAIGQLAFQNVIDATPLQLHVDFAAPVHEQDVIGAECAIDD